MIDALLLGAQAATGTRLILPASPAVTVLLVLSLLGLVWRAAARAAFTAREYGAGEGVRAVLRIPLGNIIAIMAARRALAAYWRALRSGRIAWDKTEHAHHPAAAAPWQGAPR